MKKTRNIILFMLMALPTVLLTSCLKDQDDLFDKSASARVTDYLANAKRVLTSSENGWVLNYVPDREHSYGGYTFTLKFDSAQVSVYSEIAAEPMTPVTSYYTLDNENGPVLSFDTYNENMHFFATPHGSSGAGGYEAYDGDFLFIIQEISADENTIKLKGGRSGNVMYMHRLTGDTPESYIHKIDSVRSAMVYKNFELHFGTDTVSVRFARGVQNAGGNFTFNYKENGADQTTTVPVAFTLDGIQFMDTVNVLGHTITGMRYIEGVNDNIPALNDDNIRFVTIVPPLSTQLLTGEWFIAYSQLGELGQAYWNYVKEGLSGVGEELYYAYLGDSDGFGLQFGSTDGSALYGGGLFLNATVLGDDMVSLQFAMAGSGDGVWYHNNANFSYALVPFGYSSANTFKLTTDNLISPSYIILTDQAHPNNVIKLLAEVVYWPFDN